MKVGSAVLAVHVAVLGLFALTQGCVTTESQGSGRGAGARHRGIVAHEHKAASDSGAVAVQQGGYPDQDMGMGAAPLYAPPVIESRKSYTPVEPMPPVSTAGTEVYIVKKGDILSQLAVDFGTTTAELVRLNSLSNPDVLYVGQELRVPAGRGGGAAKKSSSAKPAASIKKGGTYTIQKGDTLSGIALAAGVSVADLRALNNIEGDRIIAGETLDIPAGGKVPAKAQKSTAPKKEAAPVVEPAPAAVAPAPAPVAPAPADVQVEPADTVKVDMVEDKMLYPGETLDDVARQYGVTKAEIMRLNNITDETQVREGQRLRIPIAE